MRIIVFIAALALLSCGQSSTKEKETQSDNDSSKTNHDTTKTTLKDTQYHIAPGEAGANDLLKARFGSKWHVMNDKEAKWMKDEFDYFIVPERKKNPDYPYIAKGDFNADSKTDVAALVTDSSNSTTRIAIFLGAGNIVFWQEDVQGAAIAGIPKSDIEGIEGGKVKMKSDGINVAFFEKSSYVIYWNGSSFKNTWTSD